VTRALEAEADEPDAHGLEARRREETASHLTLINMEGPTFRSAPGARDGGCAAEFQKVSAIQLVGLWISHGRASYRARALEIGRYSATALR
jgi:hypothetical protein